MKPITQQINVDPSKLDEFKCPECENVLFVPVQNLRYVPALISPAGVPALIHLQIGIMCTNCNKVITQEELQKAANQGTEPASNENTPILLHTHSPSKKTN